MLNQWQSKRKGIPTSGDILYSPNRKNRLGVWVRQQRIKKGYTVELLAQLAGVSEVLITEYEWGKRDTGTENLLAIIQALGVAMPWGDQ